MSQQRSLRGVFLAVAALAVTIHSPVDSRRWWDSAVPNLVLLALYYATLRAAVSWRKSAFWLGFAFTGWVWLGLSHLHVGQMIRNGVFPLPDWLEYMKRAVRFEAFAIPDSPIRPWEFLCLGLAATAGGFVAHLVANKGVTNGTRKAPHSADSIASSRA